MHYKYRRKIILEEKAGIEREHWPVIIKLSKISGNVPSINWDSIRLIDDEGNLIPCQVDDIDGVPGFTEGDELVFQVNMSQRERKELYLYYGTDPNEKEVSYESDLSVVRRKGRVLVENSKFRWELTDTEDAELRLKTSSGISDSWEARIWTWAGGGHKAPIHDVHYQNRRLLNNVKNCRVISVGPVRAIIQLYYDFLHFEDNLDVERTLIIYSNLPIVEKISTSKSGESSIILATILGKMGPLTLADGSYCGSSSIFPVHYPRTIPKEKTDISISYEKNMLFEPVSSTFAFPDSTIKPRYEPLKSIDGYTWGAVWNPYSRQGKAEIAEIKDVKGFFLGWEWDREFLPPPSYHPLTDRVFGDFLFACTKNRTFKHYTFFFTTDKFDDPRVQIEKITKLIANPISVSLSEEELCDPSGKITVSPSRIIFDLSDADEVKYVNLRMTPINPIKSLSFEAPEGMENVFILPKPILQINQPIKIKIGVKDVPELKHGVSYGKLRLIVDKSKEFYLPFVIRKSGKAPKVEVLRKPQQPIELDPVKVELKASSKIGIKKVLFEYGWGKKHFKKERIFEPEPEEVKCEFIIPPQRPARKVWYRVEVTDIHGKTSGFKDKYDVLDVKLLCPLNAYIGEKEKISLRIRNIFSHPLKANVSISVDGKVLTKKPIEIADKETQEISVDWRTEKEGTHLVKALLELEGTAVEVSRKLKTFPKPEIPFEDFCSLLRRSDKRTLHGNLLRYWGGQPHVEWKGNLEDETLGFTHAWLFDGRSWGSLPHRDWEFWRKEKVAYGIFCDHKSSTFITYPKPLKTTWEPGRLDLEYEFQGLKVNETKFIYNDVLTDIIQIKNTKDEEVHFSLFFKGKGHAMSEAIYDEEREAIIIEEHGYAYTGLKKIFYSSVPFTSYTFKATEQELNGELVKASLNKTSSCYGEPVWYAFQYELRLKPKEQQKLILCFTIDRDVQKGYKNIREIIADPDGCLKAVRWEWNHWLNYEVPRFHCSNKKYEELYYYLWFVYKANIYDVGKGWYKHPYVAPSSVINFMTQFGWDSAFHVFIGKWLAHPEKYAYGNLKNWAYVQAPCGFLPEFFGQDWRTTWSGNHGVLLTCSLYDLYKKNGDLDLVKFMYPVLKKFEEWRSCELEYSPYWTLYHRNIGDWEERRKAFKEGKLWVGGELDYYEKLAELAKIVGDKAGHKHILKKMAICKEKRMKEIKETSLPDGHTIYWCWRIVPRKQIKKFLKKIFDPNKYYWAGKKLPITQMPLDAKRPGDIWDHGTSVTVNYFPIEGLFRSHYDDAALKILTRLIEASFIETSDGPRPCAPEYWDEKAHPWGSIEYAWNGLINNFIIERVCGIMPDIPRKRIIVEPHLPEELNSVEVAVPFTDGWTTFTHKINRKDSTRFIHKTKIRNALHDIILRFKVPKGSEVSSIRINGQEVKYKRSGEYVEIYMKNKRSFTITVICKRGG